MKKTFAIGGVHPHDSKLSRQSAVEELPLPETVAISMAQHLGAPATPIVAVGDKVLVGQLIAEPSGFVSAPVHSSVSGTVKAIEPRADLAGNPVPHVVIEVEGDAWLPEIDRTPNFVGDMTLSAEQILARIKEAGIVGLGGAAFPTHIKLSPPPGKKAEVLILNGTECEPYLTSDDHIMRDRPDEIAMGAQIMMKALGVGRCYIGIEENKPEAIKAMRIAAIRFGGLEVVRLKKKYPQGGEKQLIDAIIGRRVPSLGLPIDTGAVVQNVGTALAVYEAVQKHKPLIDNMITVTGRCLPVQKNFLVRIGTPFSKLLEAVGGIPENAAKIISGGPMMGKAISNLEATTVKASSAVLVLTEKETKRRPEGPCIRCGKCADACPMGLQPFLLYKLAKMNRPDEMEQEKVFDCIECGCCLYTCPAGIPLLDLIRIGKADVMKIMRSRKK
ncbi:MAG: electron transport complex subunit RsxC [Bacteroidales bacterium]|nr:electron transport complex subunit RsxC [Bacteroidales bacterium]